MAKGKICFSGRSLSKIAKTLYENRKKLSGQKIVSKQGKHK
jgi:hypothetical protein